MKKRNLMIGVLAACVAVLLTVGIFEVLNISRASSEEDMIITIGYAHDKNTIEEHIKKFESENPGIKILPVEWGYDPNTFPVMAEANTLPGIYDTHFTEAKRIIDGNYAADVTELLKEYQLYGRINDFVMENISRNGKVYFIPRTIYSMGLYMNVPVFQEAGLTDANGVPVIPDTFEELRQVAATIKEKTGKAGFAFPSSDRYGGWYFTVLAWNFNVKFTDKVDGKWVSAFDTPECVRALQYIKELKWKYDCMPQETDLNNAELFHLVSQNEVAMTFAQSVQLDQLVNNGTLQRKNIGLAKMPSGPDKRVTMVGGGYYALNPQYTDAQKEAAFRWLMYDKGYASDAEAEKQELEQVYKRKYETNDGIIGITGLKFWNDSAVNAQLEASLTERYCNINPAYVASFNDTTDLEYQMEEPVCAQELYEILDECITKVLNDKNADCAAIIHAASEKYQKDYLDYES